jgi:uncharacterized membrane protein
MKTSQQRYSKHVSVPSKQGIRVDKAITIERPVAEVYAFWRQLNNLPTFMRHLDSVVVQDELHSHWAAKTLGGKIVEWDAEVIEQRENEMISWRSLPDSEVDNAGSVWFTPVPGGNATQLRVELRYIPPAGKTGAFIAKLFGRDAAAEIDEDLQRLKSLLENGKLPDGESGPAWTRQAIDRARQSGRAIDGYVHDQPWITIGSVAAVCLLLGFFLGRSSAQD